MPDTSAIVTGRLPSRGFSLLLSACRQTREPISSLPGADTILARGHELTLHLPLLSWNIARFFSLTPVLDMYAR